MPLQKPSKPVPKGPWEGRGSIPRGKWGTFFRGGPSSIFGSRQTTPMQRKALGKKILDTRFPRSTYGAEISGSEMERERRRLELERMRAKTGAEKKAISAMIARLGEAKKRAGF